MLVFYKERLVFLAVPKTGSTAYHSALSSRADIVISNPPDLKHTPVYRYDRFFRPIFEKVCGVEMETIAVVREPVDWIGSWYRYRRRPSMKEHPHATHHLTFDQFVQGYLKGQRPGYADVGSQARFLAARPGGKGITRLFRYEDPDTLQHFLKDRLGCFVETKRENVSPAMPLSLSSDLEQRYRRKHAEEFSIYASTG